MPVLWPLVTRNWRTKPARAALATAAVTLGVAVVVWVTCCYESLRRGMTEVVLEWIGRSHIMIEPVEGVWAVFGEEVASLAASTPGVRATTVRTREYVEAAVVHGSAATKPSERDYTRIEISGVDPSRELTFRTYRLTAGRFLQPGDEQVLVVERLLADDLRLGVGDELYLRNLRSKDSPTRFRVIGVVDRRRASVNQAPMVWATMRDVQTLCRLPGMIKSVDLILHDPTLPNIRRTAEALHQRLSARSADREAHDHAAESLEVKTTEAQLQTLAAAQGLLQFIMTLLACVVLLTAFFIILTTLGMGVTEQITEIGLLRCLGVTRGGSAGFVLLHAVPVGLLGTGLGIPLGLWLQWLTIHAVPDYLGEMAYSGWGIGVGAWGGIAAGLLGAAIPAVSALGVTPVDAVRALVNARRRRGLWLLTLGGGLMLIVHEWLRRLASAGSGTTFGPRAAIAVIALYLAAAMLAPIVVLLISRLTVPALARLMRLSAPLLGQDFAMSPARSAAIVCGLMVGLSLIVGLVVWGDSVKQGWQFPREFPDAMLYSYDALPLDDVRSLKDTPGVAQFTVADDFPFSLSRPSLFRPLRILDEFSRFLAIDPDTGLALVKLTFLEGDERDARARLKAGGHLLITREFAKARKVRLGDTLRLWVGKTSAEFVIAGVVASPGVDIAISFFNATTYFQTYAVGAVIGTLDDAQRLFHRRYGKLMLMNFDFPQGDESRIPSTTQQTRLAPRGGQPSASATTGRPTFALGPGPIPGDGPEERIVNAMLARLNWPAKAFVTARELKREIDRNIDRVTMILSVIPLMGLALACLGVANLMAASVHSRRREWAVLRSIGLTQTQLIRIVLGEALLLGFLGGVMGMALGIALGRASNGFMSAFAGFVPTLSVPWNLVSAGALLAIVMCFLAALWPALRAGRSNIVAALAEL